MARSILSPRQYPRRARLKRMSLELSRPTRCSRAITGVAELVFIGKQAVYCLSLSNGRPSGLSDSQRGLTLVTVPNAFTFSSHRLPMPYWLNSAASRGVYVYRLPSVSKTTVYVSLLPPAR